MTGVQTCALPICGVIGPRAMTAPQVAFWDELIGRVVRTPEWAAEVARHGWEPDYLNAADSRRFLDQQADELKGLLSELGLVN